jgi:NAD(P)-dependent dehydrogenase (short-subunit alcohol dehydrogenase family)
MQQMADLFTNKVALVTGAAQGIGRAAALLFAHHGAKVVVSDISESNGKKVVAEIEGAGGEAIFVWCDVSDRQSIQEMVASTVSYFGKLNCAFNNAGVILDDGVHWDDVAFDKTMAINVAGVMQCMKSEIPAMLEIGGGTIVNAASTQGLVASGNPSQPAYVASKHAVIGLTKTAALTYARQNIRVNCICPGVTDTPLVESVAATGPEIRAMLHAHSPMGRMARPEEMAEAAIWLCSEKSSFVNGHALVLDGGTTIS